MRPILGGASSLSDLPAKTVYCRICRPIAALFMQEAGVTNVYQLDGGILKYFVLNERRAVDAALNPRSITR